MGYEKKLYTICELSNYEKIVMLQLQEYIGSNIKPLAIGHVGLVEHPYQKVVFVGVVQINYKPQDLPAILFR